MRRAAEYKQGRRRPPGKERRIQYYPMGWSKRAMLSGVKFSNRSPWTWHWHWSFQKCSTLATDT
jgi:hypothetical protein